MLTGVRVAQVKLNFGLHFGWAIEGALGSKLKVDATYLSPNVNLASRLEAATHQFGTSFLMSGEFVQNLSAPVKSLCRNVDVITAKGSEFPMEIWTFDITDWPIAGVFRVKRNSTVGGSDSHLPAYLKDLQKSLSKEFRHAFTVGIESYKAGNWRGAKDWMNICLGHKPRDGPASAILRVLEAADCTPPDDWEGFRKLHEK